MTQENVSDMIKQLGQQMRLTSDLGEKRRLAKKKLELQNQVHERRVISVDEMSDTMHQAAAATEGRKIVGINDN